MAEDLASTMSSITRSVDRMTDQLGTINTNVNSTRNKVESVGRSVDETYENVKIVYSEVEQLSRDFNAYVVKAERQHQVQLATSEISNLKLDFEAKFGHYAEVRRTAVGILQATDAGIVKKETISTVSEEMMITCRGYWLAPCLVALAAWINDDQKIANDAVKEAIKRDDDKTSLFFGLICRRAERPEAAMKWISRYLSRQNPEALKRESIIVLDAYSAGLFYSETDDTVLKQIGAWLDQIIEEPGFLEEETERWKNALGSRRQPLSSSDFPYLKDFSKTWPKLESIMEGANLHQDILNYFEGILATPSSRGAVKAQLDEILDDLVSGCDTEELPLMREINERQAIIDCDGDLSRAQIVIEEEEALFDAQSSFTEMLTKAVMHPEEVNASSSTQKFALALSKDWISDAYGQIIAENLTNRPPEVEINIDTFNDKTKDGSDEDRLLKAFNDHIDIEKREALEATKLQPLDIYLGIGGVVAALIGLIMGIVGFATGGSFLLGLFIVIIGGAMVMRYFNRKKTVNAKRAIIEKEFEEKRVKGVAILRAVIAEIVDFWLEFDMADEVGGDVIDLLEQLNPNEYISVVSSGARTTILNA